MKTFIVILLLLSAKLVNAQEAEIRSWGGDTCEEVLSNIRDKQIFRSIYGAYMAGYISQYNWNYKKILTSTLSNERLELLWLSKCAQDKNTKKAFFLIGNEIIDDAKKKNQ